MCWMYVLTEVLLIVISRRPTTLSKKTQTLDFLTCGSRSIFIFSLVDVYIFRRVWVKSEIARNSVGWLLIVEMRVLAVALGHVLAAILITVYLFVIGVHWQSHNPAARGLRRILFWKMTFLQFLLLRAKKMISHFHSVVRFDFFDLSYFAFHWLALLTQVSCKLWSRIDLSRRKGFVIRDSART